MLLVKDNPYFYIGKIIKTGDQTYIKCVDKLMNALHGTSRLFKNQIIEEMLFDFENYTQDRIDITCGVFKGHAELEVRTTATMLKEPADGELIPEVNEYKTLELTILKFVMEGRIMDSNLVYESLEFYLRKEYNID